MIAFAIGLWLFGLAPRPPADHPPLSVPGLTAPVTTWAVEGRNVNEINAVLSTRAHKAETRWQLDVRAPASFDDGTCRLRGVRVTPTATVELPEWQRRRRVAHGTREAWDDYLADVIAHERVHMSLTVIAARRLQERLSGVPCDAGPAVERDVLADVHRWHQAFDAWDRHGRLEADFDVERFVASLSGPGSPRARR